MKRATLRTAFAALAACAVTTAMAQNLGGMTIKNTWPSAPGLTGGGNWKLNGYDYYAGILNWTVSDSTVTSVPDKSHINTVCASLFQDFSVGSSFKVKVYDLTGFTPTLAQLPDTDTDAGHGYSVSTFENAARLFQTFYPTVGSDNVKAAALQLAVWETLYPDLDSTFQHSGNATGTAIDSDVTFDLGHYDKTAAITHVDWLDYASEEGNGQSQFMYKSSVPEPSTPLGLGVAAIGFLARRRFAKQS